MTRKAKQQPKEQPKQAAPTEAKPTQQQQPRQQEQQPKQQQQQPKKPRTPSIRSITWEYFEKFNTGNSSKKSWVKETIERAVKEPVMVTKLSRGQIMSLINQIDRHNMTSGQKILYKYDTKRGIVLLAPEQKKKGEQK